MRKRPHCYWQRPSWIIVIIIRPCCHNQRGLVTDWQAVLVFKRGKKGLNVFEPRNNHLFVLIWSCKPLAILGKPIVSSFKDADPHDSLWSQDCGPLWSGLGGNVPVSVQGSVLSTTLHIQYFYAHRVHLVTHEPCAKLFHTCNDDSDLKEVSQTPFQEIQGCFQFTRDIFPWTTQSSTKNLRHSKPVSCSGAVYLYTCTATYRGLSVSQQLTILCVHLGNSTGVSALKSATQFLISLLQYSPHWNGTDGLSGYNGAKRV